MQNGDPAPCAVDTYALPTLKAHSGVMHADDGWDAILAPYHRAMRHEPTDLHHQPSRRQEQRSPSRIGPSTNQDLTWRELGPMRIKYDMDDPLRHARRHRAAGDGCARLIAELRNAVKKRSAIAEQQAWHVVPPLLTGVNRAPLRNQRPPIAPLPRSQRLDLLQMQEEDIIGPCQYTCCHQFPGAGK